MFIYIGIAIGQFPSFVFSGFTLAIIGILIVLASVISSMGVIAYLGIGFTMISAEVIPFLVLAIGVDNMFIIKSAIERMQYPKLEDRIIHGLKEVGPSIATATICEALAFLVGSLTKMPALQTFCLQATIAIIFNFLFQIFTFVVVLIYDEERRTSGRADVFCCITTDQRQSQPRNFWKNAFGGGYNKVLQKGPCQWIVIAFSVLLLALAVFGSIYVPVGLNAQVSMEVDSDLFDYFTYENRYIEIGPPAYIVLNNFDFQNKTHLECKIIGKYDRFIFLEINFNITSNASFFLGFTHSIFLLFLSIQSFGYLILNH
jgi:predicted RND superfamily exporter protein